MAILAAVLVPTVTSKIRDANVSAALSDMNAIASTLQADIISIDSGSTTTTYLDATDATKKTVKNATIGNCSVALNEAGTAWVISSTKYTKYVNNAEVNIATGEIKNATEKTGG